MSLKSCKKAVSYITSATSYNNRHFCVAKLPDISFLMKYMTNNSIFEEKLSCILMQNNIIISIFPNLFYTTTTYLSTGIVFNKYMNFAHGNWDNYNQDNNFIFDIANNNGLESKLEDPNEPKIYCNDKVIWFTDMIPAENLHSKIVRDFGTRFMLIKHHF